MNRALGVVVLADDPGLLFGGERERELVILCVQCSRVCACLCIYTFLCVFVRMPVCACMCQCVHVCVT